MWDEVQRHNICFDTHLKILRGKAKFLDFRTHLTPSLKFFDMSNETRRFHI